MPSSLSEATVTNSLDLTAQELLNTILLLSRRRLTQKQKLVLKRVANLNCKLTMSALTGQLSKELKIGRSTVRVVLQTLRDVGLITCGDSLNKGLAVCLTTIGGRVVSELNLANSTNGISVDDDIGGLRGRIDLVDQRILNLIAERIKVAKKLGSVKRSQSVNIIDRKREIDVVRNWLKISKEIGLDNSVARKMAESLIELCRRVQ